MRTRSAWLSVVFVSCLAPAASAEMTAGTSPCRHASAQAVSGGSDREDRTAGAESPGTPAAECATTAGTEGLAREGQAAGDEIQSRYQRVRALIEQQRHADALADTTWLVAADRRLLEQAGHEDLGGRRLGLWTAVRLQHAEVLVRLGRQKDSEAVLAGLIGDFPVAVDLLARALPPQGDEQSGTACTCCRRCPGSRALRSQICVRVVVARRPVERDAALWRGAGGDRDCHVLRRQGAR